MKLEVGMYVRTDKRINKIKWETTLYTDRVGNKIKPFVEYYDRYDEVITKIQKASHNIIDLIEVGDIIKVVYPFERQFTELIIVIDEEELKRIKFLENDTQLEIKSIVTKEQFKSMEYTIEK